MSPIEYLLQSLQVAIVSLVLSFGGSQSPAGPEPLILGGCPIVGMKPPPKPPSGDVAWAEMDGHSIGIPLPLLNGGNCRPPLAKEDGSLVGVIIFGGFNGPIGVHKTAIRGRPDHVIPVRVSDDPPAAHD